MRTPRSIATPLGVVCAWAVAACAAPTPAPSEFDAERALTHVRVLSESIGARPTMSKEFARAFAYVDNELATSGLTVERHDIGAVDLPAVTFGPWTIIPARHVEVTDANLVVRLGPPGDDDSQRLVLIAHLDSMPGSPGANDNASSIAVLLEVARVLAAQPPTTPVALVFSAAEENGLVGARALARGWATPGLAAHGLVIALDMVGGAGELMVNGASRMIRLPELRYLAAAADDAGIALAVPPGYRAVSRVAPQFERSDHGAFTERGVRAVHLYRRGDGTHWFDATYHSPADKVARVHARALDETGRMVLGLARRPPPTVDPGAADGVWLPLVVNTPIARGWWLAGCAVLAMIAIGGLAIRRQHRHHPHGAGAWLAVVLWVLATGAACGLERLLRRGYPGAALHHPTVAVVGAVAVLLGLALLAAWFIGRHWGWRGERRYLWIAVAINLSLGAAAVVVGAAELAWLWLWPAACFALASLLRRGAAIAIGLGALAWLPLVRPAQLAELSVHGFYPTSLPIALWLGIVTLPLAFALGYLARRRATWGPGSVLLAWATSAVAVAIGAVFTFAPTPPCNPERFAAYGLACEHLPR